MSAEKLGTTNNCEKVRQVISTLKIAIHICQQNGSKYLPINWEN